MHYRYAIALLMALGLGPALWAAKCPWEMVDLETQSLLMRQASRVSLLETPDASSHIMVIATRNADGLADAIAEQSPSTASRAVMVSDPVGPLGRFLRSLTPTFEPPAVYGGIAFGASLCTTFAPRLLSFPCFTGPPTDSPPEVRAAAFLVELILIGVPYAYFQSRQDRPGLAITDNLRDVAPEFAMVFVHPTNFDRYVRSLKGDGGNYKSVGERQGLDLPLSGAPQSALGRFWVDLKAAGFHPLRWYELIEDLLDGAYDPPPPAFGN